ncbi:MAG: hypothetical protein P9L88_06095 [Candidatus Tantalella remota]|nr:hypothetical protein [Candidatus Tantalella remota]
MKRLKILFQEPFIPRQVIYGKFAAGTGNNTFPFGVASIASYINERGFPPEYIDPNIAGLSENEYASFLQQKRFNVIAMSSTTLEIDYVIKTFELIKRVLPGVVTVLGECTPLCYRRKYSEKAIP